MEVNVTLSIKKISSRGREVQKLLRPLVRKNGAPAFKLVSQRANFIIAAHDGAPVQSDYRNWRFGTFLPEFSGSYFELWKLNDEDLLIMDRAYLSIYEIDKLHQGEKEYFALHCDPYESPSSPHYLYKVGPHLHIQAARQPIPHAHIALNQNDTEKTLSSLDSLSEALKNAIKMLKEQILDAQ